MCHRIECSKCHKPSYAGCGRHIEQVLGDVAVSERCKCREEARAARGGKPTLFERLFGKT